MNFMLWILAVPQRLGKSGRGCSGQQRPLLIGTMPRTLLQAPAAVARVKWHADRLERLAPLAASSCARFGRLQADSEQNLPPVRTRWVSPPCTAASIAARRAALTNAILSAVCAVDAISADFVGQVFSVSP